MQNLLVAALFSLPAVAQAVLHVGQGQVFSDIGTAIAAAAPGDRVLVHAGTYAEFALTKGLTVRAEPIGAQVQVRGANLANAITCALPPGENAVIAGLSLYHPLDVQRPTGAATAGVLSLESVDSGGGITLADAHLTMRDCLFGGGVDHGIAMTGAATLSAVQSWIAGGFGNPFVAGSIYGLRADHQSRIHLSGCRVRGGGRGWLHSVVAAGDGVGLFGAARAWFVDCTLEQFPYPMAAFGIDNQSSVAVVVERCVVLASRGAVQNGFLLGLSTATPLVRGGTFQLDFASRPGLPVIAHASLQLGVPAMHPALAQPEWGFVANSWSFALLIADPLGHASTSFTLPNSAWLQDVQIWFCGWSELGLPVQLAPVLGGPIR